MMEFRTGVIRPVECFQEGWELIKNRYWLFFGVTIVGMLIGSMVPLGIVLGAMMCGIYYCLFKRMGNQQVEFGDLFKGFDYFKPSLIVTLFVAVPTFLFTAGIQIANFSMQFAIRGAARSGANMWDVLLPYLIGLAAASLIFALLLSCLHALIMFAYPLIIEHRLAGMDAFKLSARAVLANLGGVVGIILCEFVLGLLGALLCGVGAWLVMPLNFAAALVAYRKVFPHVNFAAPSSFAPPPPPDFANQSQWR